MKARMVLRSEDGNRDRQLDALRRYLAAGERVVVSIDTYTENDATVHLPLDPAAEVVAVEPPTLHPGGVTEIASYVVCRGSTEFRRVRLASGEIAEEGTLDLGALRSAAA